MMADPQTIVAEVERRAMPEDPADVYAAWLNEQPRFRPHRARLSYEEGMTMALVNQFAHDPKLVNEVVTGACVWPPDGSLEELVSECRKLMEDQRHLVFMGLLPATSMRRMRLVAAHRVLSDLVEQGPDWNSIVEIRVKLNPKRSTGAVTVEEAASL